MRIKALATLLACLLTGCASASNGSNAPDEDNTFVSVVGTPFYLAFKIPICVVSAAFAAPVAGASGFMDTRNAHELRRDLGEGLTQNCGPPYALTQ